MRLEGKAVLITGATSGIGAGAARIFAREGAHLMLAGRRTQEGEAVASSIREAGGVATFAQLDVTDEAQITEVIDRTVQLYGKLDCLFNNAGGASEEDGKAADISLDVFWSTVRLNLFGPFACSRVAVPHMIRAGGGSIINNASYLGLQGLGNDAYSAAKGGVLALTRSMAAQLAGDRVRVNAIAPRVVASERVLEKVARNPLGAQAFASQPLGVITPEEIGHLAVYLASAESATTSGQTFYVNGGAP